jgi:hypothetical protein
VRVEAELAPLRAENARLLKLLTLSPQQTAPPVPGQAAFFEASREWLIIVRRRKRRWRSSERFSLRGLMCTRSGMTTSGPGNRGESRRFPAADRRESGMRTGATCR